MKQTILILIVSLFCCCNKPNNKEEYFDKTAEKFALLVLSENRIGQQYTMECDSIGGFFSYETTFIGKIKNSKENNLDFVFYNIYFGIYKDSPKASSRILIFKKKKLWGYYYLGGENEIPTINGSDLIFFPDKPDCNLTTAISFRDSIPQQIFIKCRNENENISGDLFSFYKIMQ